jgi:zinc transport system permease protein
MLEALFTYKFLQYALISGLIIGLVAPLLGVFIVVRRQSLIADALSHITLAGVAAGLLLGQTFSLFANVDPIFFGMFFSVAGALLIEQLRKEYKFYQELAIPIILSAGIGLGVVFISLANGFNADLFGYLFGNILAVSQADLLRISIAGIIVLFTIWLLYKEMLYLSFDEENARLSGIPHRLINLIFSVLVAFVISISMQVVGILLVSAMLTLPVAAALRIARSFRQTIFYAIIFGELAVISGLISAYYFNLASGGTIVLVSVLLLVTVLIKKKFSIIR